MSLDTDSRVSRTVSSTGTATHTRYTTATGQRAATVVVWWIRAWRVVVPAVGRGAAWIVGTVTPAGWLAVAAVAGLFVGLAFGWVELVIPGIAAVVLLVVAVPFLLGAQSYAVDLTLDRDRVVVGDPIEGAIVVRNTSTRLALPGRVDIPTGEALAEVHVPWLLPDHAHTEPLAIATRRRGVIAVGPVTSVRSDPLGILRREVQYVDVREIFVHPKTVSIPSTSAGFIRDLEGDPSTAIVADDISFHAIREYAHGDAQRHIHWKSTAKTGSIMVRQFEETRRSRLVVALSRDLDEYASEAEFELAVSVVGSLGVRAIRDSRDLSVVTSDDVPEFLLRSMHTITTLNVVTARTLLDELCRVRSANAVMAVEKVCEIAADLITDLSIAFLVCGSKMDARRLRRAAAQFPAGVAVLAIICDEGGQPVFREFSGMRMMSIGVLDDLAHLMARVNR